MSPKICNEPTPRVAHPCGFCKGGAFKVERSDTQRRSAFSDFDSHHYSTVMENLYRIVAVLEHPV
jgi:hypothetical protein